MEDVSIIGVGQTPVAKHEHLSIVSLGSRTCRAAMADAGIDDADAAIATRLVCRELRSLGAPVEDPVSDAGDAAEAYVLMLDRLGQQVFVTLRHEAPLGTIRAEEEVQVASIEEIADAAPVLAEAVFAGIPAEAGAGGF